MRYKFEDGKIVIHAPGDERERFLEVAQDWYVGLDGSPGVSVANTEIHFLLGRLWDCTDILPGPACEMMGLPPGSTYSQAARKFKGELGELESALESMAEFRERNDETRL